MPELPDVETFKRYLDATALHARIEAVEVLDERVLEGVSPRALSRRLPGTELTSTRRHGKLLFAALARGGSLVLHFGMTGFLRYFRRPESAPAHPRLYLHFEDGYHLAFDSQRRIGRVGLTGDVDDYIRGEGLGPDALSLTREDLGRVLRARRGATKAALMDQSAVAGIGNVYSDEILFHARIHPRLPADSLGGRDLHRLHREMRSVLTHAIEVHADPERMPRSWITPRRRAGERCPRCGGPLEQTRVIGRTAYVCSRCQPRKGGAS